MQPNNPLQPDNNPPTPVPPYGAPPAQPTAPAPNYPVNNGQYPAATPAPPVVQSGPVTPAPQPSVSPVMDSAATPAGAAQPHDLGNMLRDGSRKAKKSIKGITRDVFVNVLVGGVLAVIGLLVWHFTGIVGVHYSEAEDPWLDMRNSYRSLDSNVHFNTPITHPSSFSSLTPEKVNDTAKSLSTQLDTYKRADAALYSIKAFTQGDLAASGQALKKKAQSYTTYVEHRIASYRIVMSAVMTCPNVSTTTALATLKTCKQTLAALDTSSVRDAEFKAFLSDYTVYTDKAIEIAERWAAAAPSAQRLTISTEFNTLTSKHMATRLSLVDKQQKSLDAVKLNTEIDALERELSRKLEAEKR